MNYSPFIKTICLLLFVSFQNLQAQWKTAAANNIVNDIIITYEVIYEKEPTEKQKKYSSYTKEIIVTFNKDKLIKRQIKNSLRTQTYTIYDYNKEIGYSCSVSGSSKSAVSSKFTKPKKEAILQAGESKKILGFPCEKSIVAIMGKPYEIYATKKLGLKYVGNYNTQGFLLDYVEHDKYLGTYRVVAKNIKLFKLPSSLYSLEGFNVQTTEEYDKAKNKHANRYDKVYKKMLGNKTPRFKFRTLSGKKISSKNIAGKVVVLNFWFTTCPPCKSEIPHLNKLKEEFSDNPNVIFLAVALDDESRLNAFLKKNRFDYEIASDGRYDANLFNVPAYPTNIIIDKEGNIQYYKVGGLSGSKVKELSYQIDDLLEVTYVK